MNSTHTVPLYIDSWYSNNIFFFLSLSSEGGVDQQLVDFLTELNLEKYIEVFEREEMDFQSFLNLTDEDLKRIGVTWVNITLLYWLYRQLLVHCTVKLGSQYMTLELS